MQYFSTCKLGDFRIIHDATDKFLFKVLDEFEGEYRLAELGLHAGLLETSIALYTHPDCVRIDKLEPGLLPPTDKWAPEAIKNIIGQGLISTAPNGVIGNPCSSTSEQGKQFYERLFRHYEDLCKPLIS